MKKVYDKIFKLLNEYEKEIAFNVKDLEVKSKLHLYGLELKEKYGLDLDPKKITSHTWNTFGQYMAISLYGDKVGRTISWSDNGEQPDNELLLRISFPTGGYVFGQDYPQDFFMKFFNELREYNPKYSDTTNNCLYFSMDNSGIIFNKFDSIMKKYHEENKEDYKKRQIESKKEELQKLMDS